MKITPPFSAAALPPPFLKRACFCCAVLAVMTTGLAAAPKNVLLLFSDNQIATDMSSYGHPVIRTPNLDALAQRGTRFLHAFATVASCGPSRNVVYTGLLTHANGQYTHYHSFHNGVLDQDVLPVFDLVRKAGYRTALFGKAGFSQRHREQYQLDLIDEGNSRDIPGQVKLAEQFIRESGDRPFFVVLSTHDPHPQDRSAAQRRRTGVQAPRPIEPDQVVVPNFLPDRLDVKESLAEYYELIERLDAGFGEALEMLERSGQAENTLVFFFSDHGSSYPGAYSHYEPGVHIPFIMYNPQARNRGVVSDALISLADVTPTILDWTGAEGPPYPLHGRSLLEVMEQEKTTGWDSVVLSHVMHEVTMYYPMRTLRDRRYKLIWNLVHWQPWQDASEVARRSPMAETLRRGEKYIGKRTIEKHFWRDPVELYDLQTDPDEVVNLADDPKYADLRRELSEKLLTRLRETGDNWLERYQLPMPGEEVKYGVMSPEGYAPPRRHALTARPE